MRRRALCVAWPVALLALAAFGATETEVFHGWSKDGTWYVYEERGNNELVELYFCATSEAKPSWPAVLNEQEREETNGRSCVHFLDPNKAPYQWKAQLVLPPPAAKASGLEVLHELVTEGESPGFVVVFGDKQQVCYASALRESSKLQKTWFHPSGRFAAAMIDGSLSHCALTLKGPGKAAPPPPVTKPPAGKPPGNKPPVRKR